jgi:hypothetical protein
LAWIQISSYRWNTKHNTLISDFDTSKIYHNWYHWIWYQYRKKCPEITYHHILHIPTNLHMPLIECVIENIVCIIKFAKTPLIFSPSFECDMKHSKHKFSSCKGRHQFTLQSNNRSKIQSTPTPWPHCQLSCIICKLKTLYSFVYVLMPCDEFPWVFILCLLMCEWVHPTSCYLIKVRNICQVDLIVQASMGEDSSIFTTSIQGTHPLTIAQEFHNFFY